jgi:hypothetical protein
LQSRLRFGFIYLYIFLKKIDICIYIYIQYYLTSGSGFCSGSRDTVLYDPGGALPLRAASWAALRRMETAARLLLVLLAAAAAAVGPCAGGGRVDLWPMPASVARGAQTLLVSKDLKLSTAGSSYSDGKGVLREAFQRMVAVVQLDHVINGSYPGGLPVLAGVRVVVRSPNDEVPTARPSGSDGVMGLLPICILCFVLMALLQFCSSTSGWMNRTSCRCPRPGIRSTPRSRLVKMLC